MIDDLAPVAISSSHEFGPWNDWGYFLDRENSLYRFFERNFLDSYPEAKGSIFFPLESPKGIHPSSGHHLRLGEINNDFKEFTQRVSRHFEFAFHGTTHGHYRDITSPWILGNWVQEFEDIKPEDLVRLKHAISQVEGQLEIRFLGGKYPGYKENPVSQQILKELGFKWWCAEAGMMNLRHPKNHHGYLLSATNILELPTNLSGNCFSSYLNPQKSWRNKWKSLSAWRRSMKMESYIQYLYENGYIITIQEHFQNCRTDGQRQLPNVFDDTSSLNRIYDLLRGADIWHATCSEIAKYKENYDHSRVVFTGEKELELIYEGEWDNPRLSLVSNCSALQNTTTSEKIRGVFKLGQWVFNHVAPGKYRLSV